MSQAELLSEAVLDRRLESFEPLVRRAEQHVARGEYEWAAAVAELAAFHATWRHHGSFASDRLERVLTEVGRAALRPPSSERVPAATDDERVLHVASMVTGLAGLQHLVLRWVAGDPGRQHSVLVSQPTGDAMPDAIRAAVADRCGELLEFATGEATIIERAQQILDASAAHDLVVLHLEAEDVAPVIAMNHPAAPRAALVDHADHCFWVGRSGADLVVNLRRSGAEVARARRGIDESRLALLPTPVPPSSPHDRAEARHSLGFDDDAVVLLSVARAPKFDPRGGPAFADIHLPLLERHPTAHLLVAGPDVDHHPSWGEARAVVGDRIRPLGPRSDVPALLAAADVYVDAHPMVSITSLLEAGAAGLPLVSLCSHGPNPSIWGADAPGLDPVIVRCSDVAEYHRELTRLIDDPEARAELGHATRRSVTSVHTGDGWHQALESLVEQLAAVDRCAAVPHRSPTRLTSELDRRVATLLDALSGVEDAHYRLTGRLPERELQHLLWQGWSDQRAQFVAMNLRHAARTVLAAVRLDSLARRARTEFGAWRASRRSPG